MPCKPSDGKIVNPVTGRCVDINGKIGQMVKKVNYTNKPEPNKAKAKAKAMTSSVNLRDHKIYPDYLVLVTGFTHRLARYAYLESYRTFPGRGWGALSISCIKDDTYGDDGKVWVSYCGKREGNKIKKMLDNIKNESPFIPIDGLVVIKLNQSPFRALKSFHAKFGSNTKGEYCKKFDGFPEEMFVFEDAGLGSIAIMTFHSAFKLNA